MFAGRAFRLRVKLRRTAVALAEAVTACQGAPSAAAIGGTVF